MVMDGWSANLIGVGCVLLMKKLLIILWVFMALQPAQAEEFPERLARILHDNNLILKCEEFAFSALDGKLKFHGPDGIFTPFELRGDDIYFGGRRCELLQLRCSKQASC